MENGSTVVPVPKSPTPGVANWTPPEEHISEERVGVRAKPIHINDNLSSLDRVIICFAEFVGTGMLVFLGCMGCVANMYEQKSIPALQVSFTFGLAIMVAVQCFGHISGCHINPAVTIAAVVLGQTPIMHIPLYFVGQMLGGIGGFSLVKLFSPDGYLDPSGNSTQGVCSPGPLAHGLHAWQGACVELVLTFMLVLVCAASWDSRSTNSNDSLSLRLGLAVAVFAMAGGPYTGANLNPARSFGPALLNGDWKDWWVWWAGPMAGGLAGGLIYRFIFSREYDVLQNSEAEVLELNNKA